ncbi:unnamed protein product, partial [Ectocarpus sp. 4 AP-2014]
VDAYFKTRDETPMMYYFRHRTTHTGDTEYGKVPRRLPRSISVPCRSVVLCVWQPRGKTFRVPSSCRRAPERRGRVTMSETRSTIRVEHYANVSCRCVLVGATFGMLLPDRQHLVDAPIEALK